MRDAPEAGVERPLLLLPLRRAGGVIAAVVVVVVDGRSETEATRARGHLQHEGRLRRVRAGGHDDASQRAARWQRRRQRRVGRRLGDVRGQSLLRTLKRRGALQALAAHVGPLHVAKVVRADRGGVPPHVFREGAHVAEFCEGFGLRQLLQIPRGEAACPRRQPRQLGVDEELRQRGGGGRIVEADLAHVRRQEGGAVGRRFRQAVREVVDGRGD